MNKKFWLHYRIFLIISFIIIFIILSVFWVFLSSYEASRPDYKLDEITNLFEKKKYKSIVKYVKNDKNEFNTKESIITTLKAKELSNKITYEKKHGKNNSYIIYDNDKEIAYVKLIRSNKNGLFNFKKWDIKYIDLLISKENIKIYVPSNINITINNIKLTDNYITNNNSYPEGVLEISKYTTITPFNEYTIKGLYENSNIKIDKGSLVKNGNEYVYKYDSNEELLNEVQSDLIAFCKNYTRYVSYETGFASISGYVLPNTKTYDFLRGIASTNLWCGEHSKTEFSDINFTNMQAYSEDAFSIEASYDYSYDTHEGPRNYQTHLTIYMININNKWLIASLTI